VANSKRENRLLEGPAARVTIGAPGKTRPAKNLVLFSLAFVSCFAFSQDNVGINKAIPEHSLDVGGDVNIDGNLVLNGQAGQAGQVLRTTSSGATQWVDFSEFDSIFARHGTGSGTFTVPPDVTRVGVELQGGGGAGSNTGGGAGGDYSAFILEVTPGQGLAFEAGQGGDYLDGPLAAGSFSTLAVNGTNIAFSAAGGVGAGSLQRGGSTGTPSVGTGAFLARGQPGTANDYSYSYGPGGNTVFKTVYGSGGGVYPSYLYTPGGTRLKNLNTNTDLNITDPTRPQLYGAGGAASITVSTRNNGIGGYVRIHY
jgi:hypothetical protein